VNTPELDLGSLTGEQLHVCASLAVYDPNTGPFRHRVGMPDWFGVWNGAYLSISPRGQAALAVFVGELDSRKRGES